jgi:hypothetical protein
MMNTYTGPDVTEQLHEEQWLTQLAETARVGGERAVGGSGSGSKGGAGGDKPASAAGAAAAVSAAAGGTVVAGAPGADSPNDRRLLSGVGRRLQQLLHRVRL